MDQYDVEQSSIESEMYLSYNQNKTDKENAYSSRWTVLFS